MTIQPHASVVYAVERVKRGDNEVIVYEGSNKSYYVRLPSDDKPINSSIYAVAQRWNNKTIQVRYKNAYSEFIND